MSKKLIFFDIDGTLISHVGKSHIPEPTIEALMRLTQNGHIPAIATARNLSLTSKTAAVFKIDLTVCCNGAHVSQKGKDIHTEWLDGRLIHILQEQAAHMTENVSALDITHVYTGRASSDFRAYVLDQAGFDCRKPLIDLKRAFLVYTFAPFELSYGHEEENAFEVEKTPFYTEIRPLGVSKWSGILKAAESLGFDRRDIVTVGDGLNDISMVENAPIGIAVGRSEASLKAVANIVTGDIDEGGILDAFQKLGMI